MSRPVWATTHNAAPLETSQPWASRVPYVPKTMYRWGRGTGAWRSGPRLLEGVFTASCCYHRSAATASHSRLGVMVSCGPPHSTAAVLLAFMDGSLEM